MVSHRSIPAGLRLLTAALVLVTMLMGCAVEQQQDAELLQAERTARNLTSPRYLRQSMYASTNEVDTPSELIAFLFSTMGAAERPYTSEASEMEQEQARSIGMPLQPANVALVPLTPNPQERKQIVLKPDDANGMFIADAYVSPDQPPAFTSKWPMPTFREKN